MNISKKITELHRNSGLGTTADKFRNLFKEEVTEERKKKLVLLALLLLLVCAAFVFSGTGKSDEEKPEFDTETLESAGANYEQSLELRLFDLISAVEGVGDCKVMVTLEKGEYKMFAKDSYEDSSGNKNEYVILEDKSGGDSGLVVNVISPEIKGVAVVCEGGDSAVVRSDVVSLVTSVLAINSTQVSVTKMK